MIFTAARLQNLVEYILNFNIKTRPKNKDDKKIFLIAYKIFIVVENQLLMLLKADYFH